MTEGMKDAIMKGQGGKPPPSITNEAQLTRSQAACRASARASATWSPARPSPGRRRRPTRPAARSGSLRIPIVIALHRARVDVKATRWRNRAEGGQTTDGTKISAADQVKNMDSGSADHLDMGFRK